MKSTSKIFLLSALALLAVSCAKNDFFDKDLITGEVGPEAYWEVASAAVTAGQQMEFTAQYYSTVSTIDHSEVWYDIVETIDQTVTCQRTATFTYSLSSNVTSQKRISQLVQKYAHSEEYWSDSLHAYSYTDGFPVSGTLAPFRWSKPTVFDSTKMVTYFGEGYMQTFKDNVHAKMKFKDYRMMYLGLGILDDFTQYTDSTLDPNAGVGVYKYHFPLDAEGNEVVPAAVDSIWETITFEQLVNNTTEGYYDVDYSRTYSINAILRVYDVRGVYGRTVSKPIVIN